LEFALREIDQDEKVKVIYKAESNKQWIETNAKNLGGNSYSASMILTNKDVYNYQIITKGNINKSSDMRSIPSYFNRPNPLEVVHRSVQHWTKGATVMEFYFGQYNTLFDFHKVEKAEARVYSDNVLIETIEIKAIDLTNDRNADPYLSMEFGEIIGFKAEVEPNKTKIIVSAEFKDRSVHEGEIYPEEKFMNK